MTFQTTFSEHLEYQKGKWTYMQKVVMVPPEIKTLNIRIDNDSYWYNVDSNAKVWFDDLKIERLGSHNEILSETNYYPFGMVHKGYNELVTSSSLGENWKYQGQERNYDLGLNTDQWKYRISDPSIGRFWQIDPLAEDYVYNATYAFQENKLGLGIELEGLELHRVRGGIEDIQKGVSRVYSEITNVKRAYTIGKNHETVTSEIAKIKQANNVFEGLSTIHSGSGEIAKGSSYLIGEGLDKGGDAVEKGALIMAPLTKGASLVVTPFAEGAQVVGKSLKAAVNLSDGDYSNASKEVGGIALIKGIGKLADKAMDTTKNVGGDLTKSQNTVHQTVIGGASEALEETGNKIIQKRIEEDDKRYNY